MTRLAVFVSTFGYAGYFPVAPGTVGSLAGLALCAAMAGIGSTVAVDALAITVLTAIGVWAGTLAERHFGGIDPGPVVIDEVVGMMITLFWLPASVTGFVVGFFLFRVFDIVKPFPAARLEGLPGGLGVMADDVMAAVYAHLSLRLVWWLAPAWMAPGAWAVR